MSTLTPEAKQHLKQNPTFFAQLILNFKPFSYQQKLLNDPAKRVIACMGRQTGKTTTIATKAIHYAYSHKNTTTLIISPSLRQSMIMFDKILTFTHANTFLRRSITRKTRTIIQLTTGSQIIALPCSEHLLRGYTANLAICDEASFIPETIITEILSPCSAPQTEPQSSSAHHGTRTTSSTKPSSNQHTAPTKSPAQKTP
jgi:hypothetical protein